MQRLLRSGARFATKAMMRLCGDPAGAFTYTLGDGLRVTEMR
jgi:hypothetical protein